LWIRAFTVNFRNLLDGGFLFESKMATEFETPDESLLHNDIANSRSCFGVLLHILRSEKDPVYSVLMSGHFISNI